MHCWRVWISFKVKKDRRAEHLQQLIAQLRRDLKLKRWTLMPSDTAVQPIVIGDNAESLKAAATLYEQGFWVLRIRPPTVPVGTARLRLLYRQRIQKKIWRS